MIESGTVAPFEEQLDGLIETATTRSAELKRPVLVSLTEEIEAADSIRLFQNGSAFASERWYWEHPVERLTIVGLGVASGTIPPWRVRFSEMDKIFARVAGAAAVSPEIGPNNPGPMFFSAFSFDPERKPDRRIWRGFAPGYLLLPRVTLVQRDGRSFLTFNFMASPGRDIETLRQLTVQLRTRIANCLEREIQVPTTHVVTDPDEETLQQAEAYKAAVGSAAGAIRAGAFEKVVLARRRDIRTSNFYNIPRALERLRVDYPGCYTFAVARHGSIFLGASPERLVRLDGKDVLTECLAGSIGRGKTPDEDRELAQRLMTSPKDLHEHEVCVRAIREALEPLCDELAMPDSPELMTVSNVHHLHTPVRGHLNNGATIFKLVERLHPTPAVGGYPRDVTLKFIRENEGMDRGWYASPIGWVDSSGNGEFAVALRSALINGQRGHLFAGCGIVGESDPESELAESEIKLKPMLSAMGE